MQNIPWQKIRALEEEIKALKTLGRKTKPKKNPLKGILKGVKFSDEDFEEAEKIWFNEEHLLKLRHKK